MSGELRSNKHHAGYVRYHSLFLFLTVCVCVRPTWVCVCSVHVCVCTCMCASFVCMCVRTCVRARVHMCVRVQPLQSLLRPLHPSPPLDPLHLPRSGWTRPFPGSAGRGPAAVLCPGRPLAAAGLSPRASPRGPLRCRVARFTSSGPEAVIVQVA